MNGSDSVTETCGSLPAVILAGGGRDDKLALAAGAPCKALVRLNGRPLMAWVAEALQLSELVERVVAVEGPNRSLTDDGQPLLPIVTAHGTGFADTLLAAVEAFPNAERILVATADLPLLTPEAVDGFIRSCQESAGELSYPVVQAEAFDRAFPGRGKTVVRLREGRFTGGNLAIVTRRFVLEQGSAIERTFDRRKSPVGLAAMFGLSFILRLVTGRLRLVDLERRGTEMLGAQLRAVPVQWPEIGFDVDDPDDLDLALSFLRERAGGV